MSIFKQYTWYNGEDMTCTGFMFVLCLVFCLFSCATVLREMLL